MPKKVVKNLTPIPSGRIEQRIFWLRGEKVMLDFDLAELYEVETKMLKRAVRRNAERFPRDFMFVLTEQEWEVLRCQIGTSKRGGTQYRSFAFTEPGVAMLSSVLKSKRAVAVNIQIVRTFIQLRKMLMTHEALRKKIEMMERKYDKRFKAVFDVLRQLLRDDAGPQMKIGFAEKKK
ncbi:MAG: ORF6N domain-containing protein [Patescibacteria group bacterium]